ncbi:MAG: GDSL-type esterase/lipase family protein [Chthoniobacter sp.]|uniref:SGNH/GDSL hydrolase family protein n=1 Tax=Chthoniobacter sp. TaxID=2510640 RepID=UPI0032AC01D6
MIPSACRALFRWSLWSLLGLCSALTGHAQTKAGLIRPDDPRIGYSDYVHLEFVPSPLDPAAKLARFDRLLDIPAKGYRWDNPGARIRFRTNAANVKALLYFNELHISSSARNSRGLYYIDGVSQPEWTIHTKATPTRREPETVEVPMAAGGAAGFHDYELVLPYGDSVDFQGLEVNPDARFEAIPARPAKRYLAYGDSITHGFTASAVDKSYAYLVAQKNGWQLVNLGLGGRASNVSDARVVASLKADVISVFIGVNDWQGGGPLERYRLNMMGFLDALRATQPTVPIYYVTSLWVPPSWNPKGQVAVLESYRQVAREIVAARKDPNLHLVEGPELIDHDIALFDATPVHPNDKGFAQMAERLAPQMRQP